MKYKLRKSREQVLEMAVAAVRLARKHTDDVEFSPEDAARTDPDFLCTVVEDVIRAGAGTINIPDTVGYAVPDEFGKLIQHLRNNVPNIDKAVISVHCHNDLGLAVANSLAAVKAGARQVECTLNGIGERAGNASLEEIVMALRTRADSFGVRTGVETTELFKASRLVSDLTGFVVQKNKAVVGANAFAHEAGIHQDGVLKERTTYEIMTPESVGWNAASLVMGKHSGRNALKKRLSDLGYDLEAKELEEVYGRFLALADKKKEVYDDDLAALVADEDRQKGEDHYRLVYFHTVSGTETEPTATVRLAIGGKELQEAACGDGPIDALTNAIDRITGLEPRIVDYAIKAVTSGRDAQGEVNLVLEIGGKRVPGRGISTDVIEASARAYLNALNRSKALGSAPKGKKKGL